MAFFRRFKKRWGGQRRSFGRRRSFIRQSTSQGTVGRWEVANIFSGTQYSQVNVSDGVDYNATWFRLFDGANLWNSDGAPPQVALDTATRGVDVLAARLTCFAHIPATLDWAPGMHLVCAASLHMQEVDILGVPIFIARYAPSTWPINVAPIASANEDSVFPKRTFWRKDFSLNTRILGSGGNELANPTGHVALTCNKKIRTRITDRDGLYFGVSALHLENDGAIGAGEYAVSWFLTGQLWYRVRF